MPTKLVSSALVAALSVCTLAGCTAGPEAAQPKAGAGPLAACCEVIPGKLGSAEAGQTADVVLTEEQAAAQGAQIAGLRAAKDACAAELAKPDQDDAAGLAAVKTAAGDYDLGANISECK